MRRLATVLGAVVVVGSAVVWAGFEAAGAPPLTPVGLSADNISVDNRGTTLTATGHVAVAYGTLHVASDALSVYRPTGTATFSGHVTVREGRGRASARMATLVVVNESSVRQVALSGQASVETPSYALLADRIVADRLRHRLTAAGHVTIFSQPDLIVTGAFADYDEDRQHAVVRGNDVTPATVQNRDGRIRGTSIELSRRASLAVVHGPVRAEIYDAALTGANATIDLDRATAVITGHVVVSRRQGTLRADRLTVYYRARRLVAEGATQMRLIDVDDATP